MTTSTPRNTQPNSREVKLPNISKSMITTAVSTIHQKWQSSNTKSRSKTSEGNATQVSANAIKFKDGVNTSNTSNVRKGKRRQKTDKVHPIHECPEDIFRIIFWWAVKTNSSVMAIRISHVCRLWRSVAISTPTLWTKLVLEPAITPTSQYREYWSECVKRAKAAPFDVEFRINRRLLDDCWELQALEELDAVTNHFEEFTLFISSTDWISFDSNYQADKLRFLKVPVGKLKIQANFAHPPPDQKYWDLGTWTRKWSRIGHLEIDTLPFICPHTSNSSIPVPVHSVHLIATQVFVLDLFSGIEALKLYDIDINFHNINAFLSKSKPYIVLPHLRELVIQASRRGSIHWSRILECPQLQTLVDDQPYPIFPLGFPQFLYRHSTIRHLHLPNCIRQTPRIAVMMPQLWTLEIDSDIALLHDWEAFGFSARDGGGVSGLEGTPPFPELTTLIIDQRNIVAGSSGASKLGLHNLEMLIRRRCLPRTYPDSLLPPNVNPLSRVAVSSSESAGHAWPKSSHVDTARKGSINNYGQAVHCLTWTK